jgi:hypothetical protein
VSTEARNKETASPGGTGIDLSEGLVGVDKLYFWQHPLIFLHRTTMVTVQMLFLSFTAFKRNGLHLIRSLHLKPLLVVRLTAVHIEN